MTKSPGDSGAATEEVTLPDRPDQSADLQAVDWDDVIPRLLKWAKRNYDWVPGKTPEELVQDAIDALFNGHRKTWIAGNTDSLYTVLMGTVRSYSSHQWERTGRHVELDERSPAVPKSGQLGAGGSGRAAIQWHDTPCPCCGNLSLSAITHICGKCGVGIPGGIDPMQYGHLTKSRLTSGSRGVGRRDEIIDELELTALHELVLQLFADDAIVRDYVTATLREPTLQPAEIAQDMGVDVSLIYNAEKRLRRKADGIRGSLRPNTYSVLIDILSGRNLAEEK